LIWDVAVHNGIDLLAFTPPTTGHWGHKGGAAENASRIWMLDARMESQTVISEPQV